MRVPAYRLVVLVTSGNGGIVTDRIALFAEQQWARLSISHSSPPSHWFVRLALAGGGGPVSQGRGVTVVVGRG